MIKNPTTKNRLGTKLKTLILLSVLSLFYLNTKAQVSLTATTGTTTGTFTTLKAAFDAINAGTHQGDIVINISANTTESAVPCILQSSGAGAASYTSVLIQPSNDGVTITGSTATGRGLIELVGADNVTINGDNPNTAGTNRNLTITNSATSTITYTSAIRVACGTAAPYLTNDNISIRNVNLNGSATGRNLSSATSTTASENTTFGIVVSPNGAATPTAITSIATAINASATVNNFIVTNCVINRCARGIVFLGNAAASSDLVTLTNNVIGDQNALTGTPPYTSPSTTVYTKGIYVRGMTSLNISNNTIKNIISYVGTGKSAIELNTAIGTGIGTVTINNNVIDGVVSNGSSSADGMTISSTTVPSTIQGNTINNIQTTGSASSAGILSSTSSSTVPSTTINRNKISQIYARSTSGYAARGIVLNSGNNYVVSNNMISDLLAINNNSRTSTTYAVKGILISAGTSHKIYHNTVSLRGTMLGSSTVADNTTCLMISGTGQTGIDIRNNIFENNIISDPACANACLQLPSGATSAMNLTLNNNAYYTRSDTNAFLLITQGTFNSFPAASFNNSSTSGSLNSRTYTSTLSASGSNDNASFAFVGSAPFVSSTDLHLSIGSPTTLESGGASVGITEDFDGDVRPGPAASSNGGATAGDMGADEFDGVPSDVTGPVITYTPLINTCTTGNRTLTATISDAGSGVSTSGGDLPILYMKVNSGPYSPIQGVHLTGNSYEFTFGNTANNGDTVTYYVVAQDLSGNVSCFPSAGAASLSPNPPSAGTSPTNPSSYLLGFNLSGTYTVGVGGNYTTLTSAAVSYNGNCLTGPVIFSLTDATYSTSEIFPITFTNNSFSSLTNTLSIIPATGISSTITGSVSSPLIILNGADFVTIDGSNNGTSTRNLTILNSATAAPSAIQMISQGAGLGATNNTIKNCIIRTGINSTTGYGIAIGGLTIGTAGSDNDSILIENNIIEEPLIGIYGFGNSINSATGLDYLRIVNNSISYTSTLAGGLAIRVGNSTGSLISQNTISIETTGSSICGISLETGFVNSTVSRNLISKVKTTNTSTSSIARGISIATGQASSNLDIINNVIYNVISSYPTSTAGYNPCGIMVGSIGVSTTVSSVSGGINIDYNSINLYGSANRSIAALSYSVFFGSGASNINLRNNILTNSINNINATGTASKAYSIYSQSASTAFSNINYNDYFVSGTQGVLGFLSADVTTLTALQTAFGQNVNSLNVNPDFNSNTNIRPNLGSPVLNAGTSILGLTIDYLGVTRNVTTPSMGAYENGADGVGPVISYTAVPNQCSVSGVNLTASVYDFSGVPTSGVDVPTLYWKVGLNGTYASAPGTYTSGTNFDFTFGASVAVNDTIFYYIVAQDSLNNVSVFPSAGAGNFTASPPAVATAPSNPSSFGIGAVLSGTIPVGTGGTYTTLSSAASAYNIGCITGPIIFSLTDATYSSSETFPITFNNNSNASLTNTLSILPATGVNTTITGSSATGLIVLNGSEYITIDGSNNGTTSKNLTILNTNVSANTAGIILNSLGVNAGASNNTIKNTIFSSSINSVSNYGISIGGASPGTTGADNDSITISGNSFSNFGFGIYVGGTSAGVSDFINVSNNSHIYNGLTLAGPMFFRSTFINNSSVSSNSVDITTSGTTPVGISLGANVMNTLVEKNYLNRILTTNTGGYGGRGITVGTGLASSNITISNNVIFGVNGTNYSAFGNSSSMGIALGIDGNSSTLTTVTGGVNIYYNSINLYGNFSRASNTLTASIYVGSAVTALDIRNNVFTNSLFNTNSSGVSSKAYSIYSVAANTAFTNIDFNNYFVSGGQGVLAYLSTDITTISDLRTAFGFNLNSINSDPIYNSDALLQPSIGSPLLSVGTPIAGFTTDFTGTSRSLTSPSIGAYEIGRDGAAPTITFTSISNTQLLTNITFVSNIVDLGSGAIGLDSAGANRPTVYFKKSSEANVFGLANNNTSNGWKYTQTTSSSSPFSLEIDYSLLNSPVAAGDTILYFVTAQDLNGNLGAESTAGFAGTSVTNITNAPTSLNRYFIVGPPLSGNYSVGPAGNYTRITDAINDLNLRGLSSPVVFELTDTAYSSNETFPIVLSNTPNGISNTNTVTIQPAGVSTDCRITGSNATAIFSVDNGDYYILDGRAGGVGTTPLMTILNTSTSAGVIRFVNDATNNVVRYCKLRGVGSSATAGVVNFGTTTGTTGNDSNTISNNDIYDGATNPVTAIYSIGQDSTKSNHGNIISDNNIFNFGITGTSYGINMVGFNTFWTISGNSFYSQSAKTIGGTYYAIFVSNTTGNGHNVSGNFIGGTAPQCGSTALTFNSAATIFQFIHMNVDSGIASNVNNNTIKNINITTTSTNTTQSLIFVSGGAVNVGTGSGNHLGDQTTSGSVTINASGTSATFAAIASGTGTKMGNINISNNDIGGITINQIAAVGGMSLRGIDIGASTRGLFTVSNNIIGGVNPGNMSQNTGNNALAFINRTTSNGRLHIVSGNIIRNFTSTLTSSSITGLSSGGTINSSVTNNTIYGLTSAQTSVGTGTSSSIMGLIFGLQSSVLENTCSGNVIYGLNNTGAAKTTVTGLVVNTAATGTHNVFKNFVHSLNSSNDSSSLIGIHIAGGNATIYNNMVRLGVDSNGTDINTNRMIAGIFEAGGSSGIYFNTIYIGGAAVSAGLANTYGFYSTVTSGTRVIRNNIFSNKRMNSGSTGNHFAIYLATTGLNPTGLTLNNNNYFSSNSTIGYYNGTNRATFSDWRSATGLDAASMSEDPTFINATGSVSNIDLHITPATTSLMESGGVTISGIYTD